MGPLSVNEIISPDTNFFLAFLIGTGFGFVLEQSGFSSSRKLAGLFYGYDMVVLKVFFTGGVTALLGLLFFSLFGWIDLNMVYVNPTFLWSSIVGGLVMGAGFITGGYCPGTSFCGAAIGKIDGMIFIIGLFIGVMFFAYGYPIFETLYKSGNMGAPKISTIVGTSDGLFALILVAVALAMFYVAEWVEKRFAREEY
ncbi:MAG TPA: YeeE/YedE thiosulfate transporter family protein [Bacteroidales bacterium]|nr:YeeE/YedE thiosulfate transporter family protein [Bacteroidales bacterium]